MSEIRVTSVVGENGGDRVGLTTGLTVGPLTGTTGIGATITHQGHAQFAGVCTATSFSGSGANLSNLPKNSWTQESIATVQSGSSYEFLNIPATAREIMIRFDGLSFANNSNEIEFVLGNSGGYNTSNYIISASYEPGGNYQKRTSSITFNGIGSASYVPTGRLHLWYPIHGNLWWVEGLCFPWATEGQYQHRVTGQADAGGTLSKIKLQGSAGANFDGTGNGKVQISYLIY